MAVENNGRHSFHFANRHHNLQHPQQQGKRGPQETTAMSRERTRPMLTAPPCSQVTRAMALNYIRMLPSVSYSTVGRQDLHVSPNGIRCTCQL
jgi:hypothetical protein